MSVPQKPSGSVFEKIPDVKHVEPAIETDSTEFEKVVRSRRSTRVYSDDPIPETVVRKCLELATLAPNSSNLQCWEFYWVRDSTKKQELVKLCLGQPAAATAQELIVCVARLDTWKRNSKLMLEHLIMRVWAHKTTALACENLMLSFRAFGFDSCPMEGMDERRVQKLLGIPRAAEVCMVISAGKRAKHGIYDKQFRCDRSLFVFEV